MGLAALTSSRLRGRTVKRGTALIVWDLSGAAVVQAAFGKAAAPAYAVFQTAAGEWRIEQTIRSDLTGIESASVLDRRGNRVAILRQGEVILVGGETLQWELSSLLRPRCRVGDG